MSQQTKRSYEFGPFWLDTTQRILLRDGQHLSLTPKAYETLLALVENSGRILEKEYLLNRVWPDTFIEEMTLAKNISTLRKVLAEGDGTREYIETIPKRGYRFVAEVREAENERAARLVEERLPMVAEKSEGPLPAARLVPASAAVEISDAHAVANGIPMLPTGKPMPGNIRDRVTPSAQAIVLGSAALILVIIGTLFIRSWRQSQSLTGALSQSATAQTIKLHALTNSGNVTTAAISPDGKYVAYAKLEAGKQSLWLRQVVAASHVQIAPPDQASYHGLTFTKDGNYLYFVKDSTLYQMPVLGGSIQKRLANVAGPVTFSPDGRQLAFVRDQPGQGETAVIKANSDGSGEDKLAARKRPALIFESVAWSPDGESITFSATNADATGGYIGLFSVRVADRAETALASPRWRHIPNLAWLADASGLVLIARDRDSAAGSPYQVWHLSYPGGEARRITNDLQGYRNISLTADARMLITVQENRLINLWMTTPGDPTPARQIVSKIGPDYEPHNVNWTPDGKVAYTSSANGNEDIWLADTTGRDLKQLTTAPHSDDNPAVSADGRYLVFRSLDHRSGTSTLLRMDADGSNPKPLTGGNWPDCSADGQWVFYTTNRSGISTIWKIAMDGGPAIQITNKHSMRPAVSPDGKWLVCLYKSDAADAPMSLAVVPAEGGGPLQYFKQIHSPARWTADGRALTYIADHAGISNLWNQPLAGGPPQQLTNFQAETIFSFAWSRDGKRLALTRGVVNKDVVLINNFR